MYRNGELREVKFGRPGLVRVGCNIHANMSAYVIVVEDPHYAVIEDGEFSFRSLAPGTYRLRAWSERGGEPQVARIRISRGTNEVTIEMASPRPPPPRLDKFGAAR
jgi:hypothetical protein